jgi:hypothetical protein
MSVEANKRVIQRFTTECINTASETVAAELIGFRISSTWNVRTATWSGGLFPGRPHDARWFF